VLAALVPLALTLAAAFPASPTPAQAEARVKTGQARDWTKSPAVVEVDTTHDIYAVGDPHGDYDRLVTVLAAAKVIAPDPASPEKAQWTAGKAVLVCTGDLIDKGKESLRVIALFRSLRAAAKAAGGQVIVTMGNHEAFFLANPTEDNKKAVEFIAELKANGLPLKDVGAGTDKAGVGAFLRQLPFAARVNDWFFAHAGNTHGKTIPQLRAALEQDVTANGFQAPVLQAKDSLLEARLHPGLWWQKEGETSQQGQARLAGYVKALGVNHLVIGHQPGKVEFGDGLVRKKGQMYQAYDGLLFLIDVGMSRAVGDSDGAVLHIHTGKTPRATAVYPTAKAKQLWP
jgi:hypothetical protein